jgi:site-specific DNA-methyltransferase (adenine-specific)
MTNHLYYGDNLTVLRDRTRFPDAFVDLIYLDPPFNSNADYNALFKTPKGEQSAAQMEAFTDTWVWDDAISGQAVDDVKRSQFQDAAKMLDAMVGFLGKNALTAYLAMMAVRLIELHRVLKPTGSLYLHCDPTASHYLKILLDAMFGAGNFRNEIVWKRRYGSFSRVHEAKKFGAATDIIFYFVKTDEAKFIPQYSFDDPTYNENIKKTFRHVDEQGRVYRIADLANPAPRPNLMYEYKGYKPPKNGWAISREKMQLWDSEGRLEFPKNLDGRIQRRRFLDELKGKPVQSLWDDIEMLSSHSAERLGYPTQKPVALLERILSASSNPGDVVLDPFCGCGTTVHAAQKLGRSWIGIDITHLAIGLIEKRLNDAFEGLQYTVHGTPMDTDAARDLFNRDDKSKKQFETWAVLRIGFIPQEKKGADGGLDGVEWFGPKKEYKAIVSVKGGKTVGVDMLRSLDAVITQQGAAVGVFLTLEPPTSKMVEWAKQAGMFEAPGFAPVPRIQIVTIEQAIQSRARAVNLPARHNDTFKRAAREEVTGRQSALDL